MLPDQVLSSTVIKGDFLWPDNAELPGTVSLERGGVELNDPSQGLNIRTWMLYVDGTKLMLAAEGRTPSLLVERTGVITEVSLAFDQNMRPAVAFIEDGATWLYWYDTNAAQAVFTAYGVEVKTPRLCLDDKRDTQNGASDIIFAYIKNNNLYFRAQRDRYTVEYLLYSEVNAKLVKVGMANKNRLQFELR